MDKWQADVLAAVTGLRSLSEASEDEQNIKTLREEGALDLGDGELKGRLNYMVSLGILRKPEPKWFGQKKGGTRLFQSDAVAVLEFIAEQQKTFSLQEIRDIISQRRIDLIGKALREIGTDHLPDRAAFARDVTAAIDQGCYFDYLLVKAAALAEKLTLLQAEGNKLVGELGVLQGLRGEVKLCGKCNEEMLVYVGQKKSKADAIRKALREGVRLASSILSNEAE